MNIEIYCPINNFERLGKVHNHHFACLKPHNYCKELRNLHHRKDQIQADRIMGYFGKSCSGKSYCAFIGYTLAARYSQVGIVVDHKAVAAHKLADFQNCLGLQ